MSSKKKQFPFLNEHRNRRMGKRVPRRTLSLYQELTAPRESPDSMIQSGKTNIIYPGAVCPTVTSMAPWGTHKYKRNSPLS